jgi:glycosyltransferase involved in cell wall biosynthesis
MTEPTILLSVLIPSIPRRQDKLKELLHCLTAQEDSRLEVLVLMDNCKRPVGQKRNELMRMAKGAYLCHIDDDEMVSEDFVSEILNVIHFAVLPFDLIAYDAKITIDDSAPFFARISLGAPVEQVRSKPEGGYYDIQRPPWHWCAWRTDLAREAVFPDEYWGDDWVWLQQMYPRVQSWTKIDKPLFHHRFSTKDSSGSKEFSGDRKA